MSYLHYCSICQKHTYHSGHRCLECKERQQIIFDKQWYNKNLEDKVDWLYEKIKKIQTHPTFFG